MNETLLGKTLADIQALVLRLGGSREAGTAVFRSVYREGIQNVDAFDCLPAAVRARLAESTRIVDATIEQIKPSNDGSAKFLIRLRDGRRVESVFLPFGERRTICVSSQVGCVLDCAFCATGTMAFERNLTVAEILAQVALVRNWSGQSNALASTSTRQNHAVTNVVFMGMGEPFHNYDKVLAAARLLCDPRGLALAPRRVTISTAGVLPRIAQYCEADHPYKLAISLTTADPEKRSRLMPINDRYPLQQLRALLESLPRRVVSRVMFEVPLLGGVNDGPEDAELLLAFCRGLPVRVNLIPWNFASVASPFTSPSPESVSAFQNILRSGGLPVFIRRNMGRDVQGACGQLAILISTARRLQR